MGGRLFLLFRSLLDWPTLQPFGAQWQPCFALLLLGALPFSFVAWLGWPALRPGAQVTTVGPTLLLLDVALVNSASLCRVSPFLQGSNGRLERAWLQTINLLGTQAITCGHYVTVHCHDRWDGSHQWQIRCCMLNVLQHPIHRCCQEMTFPVTLLTAATNWPMHALSSFPKYEAVCPFYLMLLSPVA